MRSPVSLEKAVLSSSEPRAVSKRRENHNEIAGTAYYFLIPACSPFAPRVNRALNVLAIEQNHI